MAYKDKTLKAEAEKKEAANLDSRHYAMEEYEDQCTEIVPDLPASLNEELSEKIKDNPNKFIGCGG